jgi:hypothetical protein
LEGLQIFKNVKEFTTEMLHEAELQSYKESRKKRAEGKNLF